MWMIGKWILNQDNEWCGQSIIYSSGEAFRVLWNALVTLTITMVMWYVAEMVTIRRSLVAARTGEEDW